MPKKPMRPCGYPGCPNLSNGYYCEEHRKKTQKRYNELKRDPDVIRTYGGDWRKLRKMYAEANPLCEKCLQEGRYVPVEEVHHILPVKQGGKNEWGNLMSLCRSCHTKIHHESGDR